MAVENEPISVLSLVSVLIDLYREAGVTFDRLKSLCAQRRESLPSRVLEENIDQAPEEIEKVKRLGTSRFGRRFEAGDGDARFELQTVIVQLRTGLVEKLSQAAGCDDQIDYAPLTDVADRGRERIIASLHALECRLSESEKKGDVQSQKSSSHLLPNAETLTMAELAGQAGGGAAAEHDRSQRSHSGSLLSLFRHRRSRNNSEDRSPSGGKMSPHLSGPSSPPHSGSLPQKDPTPSFTYEEGTDSSSEKRASVSSGGHELTPATSSSPRPSGFSTKLSSSPAPRLPSSVSLDVPRRSSATGALEPSAENDYLGFCKGAVKLLNGDRDAMQRTKEFNDGWSSSNVYYLTCSNSKCAFASHLDINTVWTKVWTIDDKGIQFRWPFLAKSHVLQTKAKEQDYAYQCLFCVFLGDEAPILQGTDSYLEHVNEVHRGQMLEDDILMRASCVAERMCGETESFDVNLFPLTGGEYLDRREQSGVASAGSLDDLSRTETIPLAQVLSNTPWCADLDDFHPTESFEAGGRRFSLRSFRSLGQA